ncbi:MAG: NAD(P)/FAD-dependent oxidoreductase, partial [Pseudomonadota bacterium]
MAHEVIDTVVVGAGQAGLAMSAHLSLEGVPHVVLERDRIAESWRTRRWDSLVANGPAWHDRFPTLEFTDIDPDSFAAKDRVAKYFEDFATHVEAPIRCGTEVTRVTRLDARVGFRVETSGGSWDANHVVAATGPFQNPVIPPIVPEHPGLAQIHSRHYRNPGQLSEGNVVVVGAGSSGSQIADELQASGRQVYLSVGPHNRPPRAYRGIDYCWWLGVLGEWDAPTLDPRTAHITIAVSGARGGETVDFRNLAHRGIILTGMAEGCSDGVMRFAPDLVRNVAAGDANFLAMLDGADAYAAANGLDLPEEPEARIFPSDPDCLINPVRELDLKEVNVTTILWATGYALDFGWLPEGALDDQGRPQHHRGISTEPGIYFLGLPWLSRRASSFIW